jgi:hypothetical protein
VPGSVPRLAPRSTGAHSSTTAPPIAPLSPIDTPARLGAPSLHLCNTNHTQLHTPGTENLLFAAICAESAWRLAAGPHGPLRIRFPKPAAERPERGALARGGVALGSVSVGDEHASPTAGWSFRPLAHPPQPSAALSTSPGIERRVKFPPIGRPSKSGHVTPPPSVQSARAARACIDWLIRRGLGLESPAPTPSTSTTRQKW